SDGAPARAFGSAAVFLRHGAPHRRHRRRRRPRNLRGVHPHGPVHRRREHARPAHDAGQEAWVDGDPRSGGRAAHRAEPRRCRILPVVARSPSRTGPKEAKRVGKLDKSITTVMELSEYKEFVDANVDVLDYDCICETAWALKALAN